MRKLKGTAIRFLPLWPKAVQLVRKQNFGLWYTIFHFWLEVILAMLSAVLLVIKFHYAVEELNGKTD